MAEIQGIGDQGKYFPHMRFTALQRIEHIVLFTSVLILVYTGFPLKFAHTSWAQTLVDSVGGWETRRLLHRTGALMMIGVGLFHVLYHIAWEQKLSPSRIWKHPLMIRMKDFTDFFQQWKYYLRLSNEYPKMGRFTWFEKFDYWGAFWGLVIVIGTGLPLWFNDVSLRLFSLNIWNAFEIIHGDEAVLAAAFLFTVHLYNAHYNAEVFPATLRWLHGHPTMHEMEKYHPLELDEVMKKVSSGESMPGKSALLAPLSPIQRILDILNSLWPIGVLVFILWVLFDIYVIRLSLHL